MFCNVLGQPFNAFGPMLVVFTALTAGLVLSSLMGSKFAKRRKQRR